MTFQLATGDERFYVIGIYIPPDCNKGVDVLRRAWDVCPQGCKPIVLGDLNINFGFPRDKREEVIVDLLDEINLIDTLRRFLLRTPQGARTRARWKWSQKRRGMRHYTQPDYVMARAGEMAQFSCFRRRLCRRVCRRHRRHDTAAAAVQPPPLPLSPLLPSSRPLPLLPPLPLSLFCRPLPPATMPSHCWRRHCL